MSNRLLILFMLVVCAGLCPAQTLYNNCNIVNPCCDSTFIWNQFDVLPQIYHFNNDYILKKPLRLDAARTFLANAEGELQFASNGCVIVDKEGQLIPDDSGLLAKYSNAYCGIQESNDGHNVYYRNAAYAQDASCMPNSNKFNDFTLFISGWNAEYINFENVPGIDDVMVYTQINKNNDSQKYKVYHDGILQLPEPFCGGGRLVKHADGESWWLIVPLRTVGSFYSICVSPDGLPSYGNISQTIYPFPTLKYGKIPKPSYFVKWNISNDGSKMATIDSYTGNIVMYQIDRCKGLIYNPRKVYERDGLDTMYHQWPFFYTGLAFSPNSRYLYAGLWNEELQFDTEADDIASSKYIVAKEYTYKIDFDTTGFNVPDYAFYPLIDFFDHQLTPTGKIIISSSNLHVTSNWYAVIEDPDKGGADCDINLFGFKSNYANLTPANNIPNFDLGPLPPGSCNQSNTDADIESKNLDGSIVISVKNIPLGTKRVCLKIYDMLGRLLSIECFDVIPFQDYSKEIVLNH
ncbi:MAG: hypothetical protein JNK41_02070, partial [Saprospiraceae bacterium]|nr:hypothetical protein [Saprospiraceae bacterium]